MVALVPVAFTKVKFWKVDEALARKLFPVSVPPVPVVKKRLVEEAVPVKKFVDVELVVVLFTPVKFWNVDEP